MHQLQGQETWCRSRLFEVSSGSGPETETDLIFRRGRRLPISQLRPGGAFCAICESGPLWTRKLSGTRFGGVSWCCRPLLSVCVHSGIVPSLLCSSHDSYDPRPVLFWYLQEDSSKYNSHAQWSKLKILERSLVPKRLYETI